MDNGVERMDYIDLQVEVGGRKLYSGTDVVEIKAISFNDPLVALWTNTWKA
jgi:hypothetical protein